MAVIGSTLKGGSKQRKSIIASLETISKGLTVSDIVVPIVGLLIIAAVAILVFPYVQGIFDKQADLVKLNTEISQLESKYAILESIDGSKQLELLGLLDDLIPTDIEVSTLAISVKALAEDYDLVAESVTLQQSDNPEITSISEVSGLSNIVFPPGLSVVSGPFIYVGDMQNIADFLDELTSRGILISVNDLSIRHVEEIADTVDTARYSHIEDPWRLNFNVVGYSLRDPSDFTTATPLAVFDTSIIETEIADRLGE